MKVLMLMTLSLATLLDAVCAQCCPCCGPFDVIPLTLDDLLYSQPQNVLMLPDTPSFNQLDTSCATFSPAPETTNGIIMYETDTYQNGERKVATSSKTLFELGVYKIGYPLKHTSDYALGYAGCNVYVFYRCTEFDVTGECANFPIVVQFPPAEPFTDCCLRKAFQILKDHGVDEQLYSLPNTASCACYEPEC